MRELLLSDDEGNLRPDAGDQLQALAFFPSNEVDREAFLSLVRIYDKPPEADVLVEEGAIYRAMLKALRQRSSRLNICGAVTLVMLEHRARGKNLGLQGAAKVVSDAAVRMQYGYWSVFEGGKIEEHAHRLTADLADVKKCFREYKAVAHICAAMLAIKEEEDRENLPKPSAQLIKKFTRTAAYFQERITELETFQGFEVWDVAGKLPSSIMEVQPVLPSSDLLQDIFGEGAFKGAQ